MQCCSYFCIEIHVIYSCLAFRSSHFFVSFSRWRKYERTERNLKHKIRPLDDDGITPIERIRSGMGVHVQDLKNSYDAKILSNYGGLLHLQNRAKIEEDDLIFYNSPKISQILQKSDCKGLTKPPSDLIKQQCQFNYDFVKNEEVEVLIDGNAHIGTVVEDGLLKLKVDKDTVITSPHYSLCPLGTFLDFSQTKGQLISEFPFDVLNFPKNNNNETI